MIQGRAGFVSNLLPVARYSAAEVEEACGPGTPCRRGAASGRIFLGKNCDFVGRDSLLSSKILYETFLLGSLRRRAPRR